VFRPDWYREMIFPYYEEFWSYPRAAGIKVIFLSDGNVDLIADDVVACGADGIMSEPYTNWPEIARKHPDIILVGDGDHRALMTEDREAIDAMVRRMAALGRDHPRYYMSLGNHTPWHLSMSSIQASSRPPSATRATDIHRSPTYSPHPAFGIRLRRTTDARSCSRVPLLQVEGWRQPG
jgi:hypothetical protein